MQAMDKEFKQKKATRSLFYMLVLFSMIGIGGIWAGYSRLSFSDMPAYFAQFKTWMTERQAKLELRIEKVKKMANKKLDTHPPIQFEFYKTLPSMTASTVGVDKNQVYADEQIVAIQSIKTKPFFDEKQIQQIFNEELKNMKRSS
jgi:hypothetical protein